MCCVILFVDCILTILKTQSSKVSFSLYVKCLQFLSILLTEEARLQSGPDAIDGDTIAGLLETMNATGETSCNQRPTKRDVISSVLGSWRLTWGQAICI